MKLLSCPFCGNQDAVELQPTSNGMMRVHCDNCGGSGYETDERDTAIEFWNRRAVPLEPTPVSVPDGPGWWAFYGDYTLVSKRKSKLVIEYTEWQIVDGAEIIYHKAGEDFSRILPIETFKETFNGKWYRLHLPWERPQEPPRAE